MAQKWEYDVLDFHIDALKATLNEKGADGWRFTHLLSSHRGGLIIFRRPVVQQSRQSEVETDRGSQL